MTLSAAGRSPRHGPAHSRRTRPRLRDSAPPPPFHSFRHYSHREAPPIFNLPELLSPHSSPSSIPPPNPSLLLSLPASPWPSLVPSTQVPPPTSLRASPTPFPAPLLLLLWSHLAACIPTLLPTPSPLICFSWFAFSRIAYKWNLFFFCGGGGVWFLSCRINVLTLLPVFACSNRSFLVSAEYYSICSCITCIYLVTC